MKHNFGSFNSSATNERDGVARWCRRATILAVSLALLGCATNSGEIKGQTVTGIGSKSQGGTTLNLVSDSTVVRSAEISYAQEKQQYAAEGNLNRDQQLTKRVRRIAGRIIAQAIKLRPESANWAWEVNVLHSPEMNAFCMPGGKIAFYSAYINNLKSTDDEIAATLGHEISHALLNHGKQKRNNKLLGELAVFGAVTVGKLDPNQANYLKSASNVVVLSYSRNQESESDLLGMELMARAGFHPQGAISTKQKSQSYRQQHGEQNSKSEWLRTHPSDETRIRDLEATLPKVLPLYRAAKRAPKLPFYDLGPV